MSYLHEPNKVKAMLTSRRFWMAVAGVAAVAANSVFGLSEEEVLSVSAIVISWIIGDSIRKAT